MPSKAYPGVSPTVEGMDVEISEVGGPIGPSLVPVVPFVLVVPVSVVV